MKYDKGDIVIVKFPFVTKSIEIRKGRPALVISTKKVAKRYDDYTLAAITSQLSDDIMVLELLLEPTTANGLKKKSLLRLDFIMTIPTDLISRKIGSLSNAELDEINKKLRLLFDL